MIGMLEYIMNMLRILTHEVEDEEAAWADAEAREEGRA